MRLLLKEKKKKRKKERRRRKRRIGRKSRRNRGRRRKEFSVLSKQSCSLQKNHENGFEVGKFTFLYSSGSNKFVLANIFSL